MLLKKRLKTAATIFVLLGVYMGGGCDPAGGPRVVGSGVEKTERREVATYQVLELNGAFLVELDIGSLEPLTITADDNILPLITTEVREGRLVIELTEEVRLKTGILVKAIVPDIQRIEGKGAGKIRVRGIKNDKLVIELAGGYDVHAEGATGDLDLSITGAGAIDTTELSSKNAAVSITGAGSIDVHALDALDARITGAGMIRYLGDPKVTKQVLGPGVVRKK